MWHKNLILMFLSGSETLREMRVVIEQKWVFLINLKERYKYSDFYKNKTERRKWLSLLTRDGNFSVNSANTIYIWKFAWSLSYDQKIVKFIANANIIILVFLQ